MLHVSIFKLTSFWSLRVLGLVCAPTECLVESVPVCLHASNDSVKLSVNIHIRECFKSITCRLYRTPVTTTVREDKGTGWLSRFSDSLRAWQSGIESRCGEIFRTRPDRFWGTPSPLCNGYRVSFPGAAGAWRSSSTPIAEVKERVQLHLPPPRSGHSWPVIGQTLPLPLPFLREHIFAFFCAWPFASWLQIVRVFSVSSNNVTTDVRL